MFHSEIIPAKNIGCSPPQKQICPCFGLFTISVSMVRGLSGFLLHKEEERSKGISCPKSFLDHEYLLQAGSDRPPQEPLAAVSEHLLSPENLDSAEVLLSLEPRTHCRGSLRPSLATVRAGPWGPVALMVRAVFVPSKHTDTEGHMLSWVCCPWCSLSENYSVCLLSTTAKVSISKDREVGDAGEIGRGDAREHCSIANVGAVLRTLLKLQRLD